ncbi:MAG: PH domain-containing protein [Candidatus Methanoplasma sp.]|nr:PH domain-containing protein [Candidatus Methanoplasma sp.]
MTEEYKSLNPKSKAALYISYGIAYAVLFLILFAVGYFGKEWMGDNYRFYEMFSLAILIVTLAYIIVAPLIFYRHYKYALTDDKIDVLRGIIIIRRTMVPIERIHQVEVTRGPINNMLGLADVDVTTAGGIAKIQFLDIPVANSIAEDLNRYINDIVRERKEND